MSNKNIEKQYDNPTEWFKFCFKQTMLGIYTCIPGIIDSYDANKKRAKVQIALNQIILDNNGKEIDQPYPLTVDVPIIFPSSKKYILQFPLEKGDSILVNFSQRGISKFKDNFELTNPDKYGFFSLQDAIGIAGFGNITNTPAVADAITMQTIDGQSFISINNNEIQAKATNINLTGATLIIGNTTINGNLIVTGTITGATINATSSLSIAGSTLPPNHRHTGVQTGSADTSVPIP